LSCAKLAKHHVGNLAFMAERLWDVSYQAERIRSLPLRPRMNARLVGEASSRHGKRDARCPPYFTALHVVAPFALQT
jgi:hypothetical protein